MTTVYFDSSHTDEERRAGLYQGDIYVYSPNQATLGLCQLALEMSAAAFAPHAPETAQDHFKVEEYAAILADLKPRFIHHPQAKKWIREIFAHFGCDLTTSYFDVPRLRTSTSDGYLTSGIAFAFHPHRDTWYSAPSCQVNWWMPVCAQEAGNVMAIHSQYFGQNVANTSSCYDYYEWNKNSRRDAAKHIGTDTREQPKASVSIPLQPDLRVVAPVGGIMLFSAAQLHSSIENLTGKTRFSIDFRAVNIDDAKARKGAPMNDVACTGTNLRDFLRADDLARMPDAIAALHENDGGKTGGVLVYDPNA